MTLADILVNGSPGEIAVLEGTGFDAATPSNNVVTYGTRTATVLHAGRTQLHVRIPDGATEGTITVRAGSNVSNTLNYKP